MKAYTEPQILRITIPSAGPQGYIYQFFLDTQKNVTDQDVLVEFTGFKTVIDQKSANKLTGAYVDWVEQVSGAGFKVENPNKPEVNFDSSIEDRIRTVFEEEINPSLLSHGGHVDLVEVRENNAYVKMSGGCQGCASSKATLKQGIETRIKEVAPEILEVIDTTDHDAGENPYFSA